MTCCRGRSYDRQLGKPRQPSADHRQGALPAKPPTPQYRPEAWAHRQSAWVTRDAARMLWPQTWMLLPDRDSSRAVAISKAILSEDGSRYTIILAAAKTEQPVSCHSNTQNTSKDSFMWHLWWSESPSRVRRKMEITLHSQRSVAFLICLKINQSINSEWTSIEYRSTECEMEVHDDNIRHAASTSEHKINARESSWRILYY